MLLPKDPDQDCLMALVESGLKLQFSAKYQRLVLIEIYTKQASEHQLSIDLCGQSLWSKRVLDLDQVQKLMKLSPVPSIVNNVAILSYANEGLTFMFTYPDEVHISLDMIDLKTNSLAKVQISRTQDFKSDETDTIVKIGQGIQIKKAQCDDININLGDKMIDILFILGNPNKDFRDAKTSTIFLNYLELGFDLAFSKGGEKLEKIILHTN